MNEKPNTRDVAELPARPFSVPKPREFSEHTKQLIAATKPRKCRCPHCRYPDTYIEEVHTDLWPAMDEIARNNFWYEAWMMFHAKPGEKFRGRLWK
jgi:hypothetical protein